MRTRIAFSEYDSDANLSCVVLTNQFGEFVGVAEVSSDDTADAATGIAYARFKAWRKYFKERVRILDFQIKALRDTVTMLEQTKDVDNDCRACRQVRKSMYILMDERDEWAAAIDDISARLAEGDVFDEEDEDEDDDVDWDDDCDEENEDDEDDNENLD